MNTIKDCFETILSSNKEKSRQAARRVRKLLYSSCCDEVKHEEIAALVKNAPDDYNRISENWRQENFVIAVSVIYFLHDKEERPDFLFPWLFELLQHSNGYIRYAAVKMISNEIGPLTYHIRFPNEKQDFHSFSPQEADAIIYSLFNSLNGLLSFLWKPEHKKYKYIDFLPVSSFKSVQMVLADLEDSCGQEYIDNLNGYFVK